MDFDTKLNIVELWPSSLLSIPAVKNITGSVQNHFCFLFKESLFQFLFSFPSGSLAFMF